VREGRIAITKNGHLIAFLICAGPRQIAAAEHMIHRPPAQSKAKTRGQRGRAASDPGRQHRDAAKLTPSTMRARPRPVGQAEPEKRKADSKAYYVLKRHH